MNRMVQNVLEANRTHFFGIAAVASSRGMTGSTYWCR